MGMGEPLLNLENVNRALVLMTDPSGIGIPPQRITLSTVGLVPKIFELAKSPVVPNLAISLSATTDEVRNRLMPVNRKYPIRELIQASAELPQIRDARRRREGEGDQRSRGSDEGLAVHGDAPVVAWGDVRWCVRARAARHVTVIVACMVAGWIRQKYV